MDNHTKERHDIGYISQNVDSWKLGVETVPTVFIPTFDRSWRGRMLRPKGARLQFQISEITFSRIRFQKILARWMMGGGYVDIIGKFLSSRAVVTTSSLI
jgi:hypothetical protein